MSRPVKQHYVPRFYLKGWAHPESGRVVVYRRLASGELERKERAPSGIAFVRGLYDVTAPHLGPVDRVEMAWGRLETSAAPVMHRVLNEGLEGTSPREQEALAKLLLSLLIRPPEMLDRLQQDAERLIDDLTRGDSERERRVFGGDPAKKREMARSIAVNSLPGVAARSPYLERFSGQWALLRAEPPRIPRFITTDIPLIEWPDEEPDVKFTIALSPEAMLVIAREGSSLAGHLGEQATVVAHAAAVLSKATTVIVDWRGDAEALWLPLIERYLQRPWLRPE